MLADLPAFVAVAERLSFRAAADALGLTPAALSKAINRLEARVGEPLMRRTTRRVELTAAGAALRVRAVEALHLVSDGMAAAAQEREIAGVVRVSAPALVQAMLGDRLADLMRRHPGVIAALVPPPPASDGPVSADPAADLTLRLVPRPAPGDASAHGSAHGSAQGSDWVSLGEIAVVTVAAPMLLAATGGRVTVDPAAPLRRLQHDPPLPGRAPGAGGPPDLVASDPGLLIAAALAGAGTLATLRPLVAAPLAAGLLADVARCSSTRAAEAPAAVTLQARRTPGDGAAARLGLVLDCVTRAADLPAPDAGQASGAWRSDATAPSSSNPA